MAAAFRRTRHGIEVKLSRGEALVLRQLAGGLLTRLEIDGTAATSDPLEALVGMALEPIPRPTDPVLARLLPDGYGDDEEAAADFRRYTEPELRATKRAALRAVVAAVPADGGRVALPGESAESWLRAINDLRLSLGTELDVSEDVYDEIDRMRHDDPRLPRLAVYEWLGYLEESLVRVLAGG